MITTANYLMKVIVLFAPVVYRDGSLNEASQRIGCTECYVSGETQQQLFENIKEKIWAKSSEATILDKAIADEYNKWVACQWGSTSVPKQINNIGQQQMRFALPYSQDFKQWLRSRN